MGTPGAARPTCPSSCRCTNTLGSAAFSYLLFRSRYVPRALAGFGVVASLAATITALTTIGVPEAAAVAAVGLLPLLVYELALGSWLLFKGVRV